MNAFKIVADFERAIEDYTGAPHAVAVNSCTNALFLCLKWYLQRYPEVTKISIPKHTYLSVPMQIIHAGGQVLFIDRVWEGQYRLYPLTLIDAARRFTSKMFIPPFTYCLSFHWSKILGISQGGAILTDNRELAEWAIRARFDGRTPGLPVAQDNPIMGYHCYMTPAQAAEGLTRMMYLPRHNPDLPNDDYPDLSKMEVFK